MRPINAGNNPTDWNLCPNMGPAATFSFQRPLRNVPKITFLGQNRWINDNSVIFKNGHFSAKLRYIIDIKTLLFIFQATFILAYFLIGVYWANRFKEGHHGDQKHG
jgi:hypothetical protein